MTKSICCSRTRALVSSAIMQMIVLPATAQDCPQLLGRWPFGTARAVAVTGGCAFVADESAGLTVVDVSAGREDALYYCYGSVLDNSTSDPTTVLPQ